MNHSDPWVHGDDLPDEIPITYNFPLKARSRSPGSRTPHWTADWAWRQFSASNAFEDIQKVFISIHCFAANEAQINSSSLRAKT
jgi:hypothetical protein